MLDIWLTGFKFKFPGGLVVEDKNLAAWGGGMEVVLGIRHEKDLAWKSCGAGALAERPWAFLFCDLE